MSTRIYAAAGVCLLAGCANLGIGEYDDPERGKQFTGIDMQSAFPVTRRAYFEKVNLIELIDPDRRAPVEFESAWKAAERQHDEADPKKKEDASYTMWGAHYDLAFAYFRKRTDLTEEQKRMHRNSVQERIISVSVSRCNVFKTYLRRQQTDTNYYFGIATSVVGALGAIATATDFSRLMAGAAGALSGVRAEYNQNYYSNLAAQVIIKGIELKQELVYRRIQSEGQSKSITDYPLEAAIKDAVYFDGLCSAVVGLEQAGVSVDQTAEPGLEALTRGILRARIAKEAADLPRDQLLNPDTLRKLDSAAKQVGISLVGSTLNVKPVTPPSEVDPFVVSAKLVERVKASAESTGAAVEAAANERRKALIEDVRKKDPKQAETLEKNSPKQGALAELVSKAVYDKLVAPVNLEKCYAEYVAPAMLKREEKIKAKSDAKGADVPKAEYELKEAIRRVEAALDELKRREELIALDKRVYQEKQTAEVKGKAKADDLAKPDNLVGTPERKATVDQECKGATMQTEQKQSEQEPVQKKKGEK